MIICHFHIHPQFLDETCIQFLTVTGYEYILVPLFLPLLLDCSAETVKNKRELFFVRSLLGEVSDALFKQ